MRPSSQVFLVMLIALSGCSESAVSAEPLSSITNFHPVSDKLLTGGQVTADHVAALTAANVDLVINLATASRDRNAEEGFFLAEAGINYVQIPVAWDNPTAEDLELFFAIMQGRGERKTLVHCFMNYRGSAFTYLYRVLVEGVDESKAREDLEKVWSDEDFAESPAWREFIDAQLAGQP